MAVERRYGTTPFALKYRLQRERLPYTDPQVRQLPLDKTGVYTLWLPSEIPRRARLFVRRKVRDLYTPPPTGPPQKR